MTNPAAAAAISAQVAKSNGAFQIAFAGAGGTIGNGIAGRGIGGTGSAAIFGGSGGGGLGGGGPISPTKP